MAIRTVITRGFGNGTFNGTIPLVVRRGYAQAGITIINICREVMTYLKTKSDITDVIGSGTSARIYHGQAKQGVSLPYVVMEQFGDFSAEHINGRIGVAADVIRITCYASTSSGAYDLYDRVRRAPFHRYRGSAGNAQILTVTSTGGHRTGYDPPTRGSAQPRFWIARDYLVWHDEAKDVYS